MDTLVNALHNFFSEYVVAAAIIAIAIIYVIWWLASRFQAMKDKVDSINTLPCAHHDLRINAHDTRFSEAQSALGEMKGQLDLLVKISTTSRTKPQMAAEADYSEKQSPRKLNRNGEQLYMEVDGDTFLTTNLEYFVKAIDTLSPKTALDVEHLALAVLRASVNLDMFIPLKRWVYNAPTREIIGKDGTTTHKDVSMDDVLFILSLPLRDKYLALRPQVIQ